MTKKHGGYDALMQDDENEMALDCGCHMKQGDDGTTMLWFCALHRAAPDLLAACKELISALCACDDRPQEWPGYVHGMKAIDKAEGR